MLAVKWWNPLSSFVEPGEQLVLERNLRDMDFQVHEYLSLLGENELYSNFIKLGAQNTGISSEYGFALETIAEEKLTWDYVRDRLLHEYKKMHTGNAIASGSDVNQDALISCETTDQKKPFDKRKFKETKVHFVKDCFKRKVDERKPRNQEAADKIETIDDAKDGKQEIAFAVDRNISQFNELWIYSGP
eukprot:gene1876-16375_t